MSNITEAIQSLSPGNIVTLFQLDTAILGGPVYYFTSSIDDGEFIVFDNITYTAIDMEATGFEYTSRGALPRPTIKISNVNNLIGAAAITYSDLLGSTLTRIRTFSQFLDNGSNPDPSATLAVDVYKVNRKVNHNKIFIEWELAASIDQEGKRLPGRQILRDACTHTYRIPDENETDGFRYTKATCPYAGTTYYNVKGERVLNASEDKCSKRLSSGCKKRYQNEPLPFRGFPGVARVT